MSVLIEGKKLRLINVERQPDGVLLYKIEDFTEKEIERGFYRNGVKVAEILDRFNFAASGKDWLSMRPHNFYYTINRTGINYGEHKVSGNISGRGIRITNFG